MELSLEKQYGLISSDDVAKGPPGTNVPMAIKFSPDGKFPKEKNRLTILGEEALASSDYWLSTVVNQLILM